jgi:putative transposase
VKTFQVDKCSVVWYTIGMTAIVSYRYNILPTPEQEEQFLQWAGCRRRVYNWGLDRKKTVYAETKKTLRYKDLAAELVLLKKEPEFDFLNDCPSQILQQALMDMEKAFTAFFKKISRYPRFRCKGRNLPTFRIPQSVVVTNGKVYLPKLDKPVDIHFHRRMTGVIKSATFTQNNRGLWFVTFVSHQEVPVIDEIIQSPIGLDAGLKDFLVDSDGNKTKPPRFYRKAQRKIKKDNKRLERRSKRTVDKNGKRGKLLPNQSKNREKAKGLLSRTHARARNRRKDFLHKLSNTICKAHDVICIESLNIQALVKTKLKGHAKSFYDAAHGQFRFFLDYKSQREGGIIVRVDRWFASSQLCSTRDCHYKNKGLTMSDRFWTCPCCGVTHDRDINAATNILIEGMRMLAAGNVESQNVCHPCEDGVTAEVAVTWRERKTAPEQGRQFFAKQNILT